MIYGIGVDIAEIDRIERLLDKTGEKFIQRVLTEREQQLLKDKGARKVEFVTGRFSAKEAISKAFGTGIGEKISFLDIEVLNDPLGKPIAVVSPSAISSIGLKENTRVHLSISHCDKLATAYAIVETE
jgi:holo-[acyl-carrier protein] synthase